MRVWDLTADWKIDRLGKPRILAGREFIYANGWGEGGGGKRNRHRYRVSCKNCSGAFEARIS